MHTRINVKTENTITLREINLQMEGTKICVSVTRYKKNLAFAKMVPKAKNKVLALPKLMSKERP